MEEAKADNSTKLTTSASSCASFSMKIKTHFDTVGSDLLPHNLASLLSDKFVLRKSKAQSRQYEKSVKA